MAGIIPGIFIAVTFMVYVYLKCKNDPNLLKNEKRYTWKDKFELTKKSFPLLLAPIIILGGIYGGYFTATESAAVAVIYAFVLYIVTGKRTLKDHFHVIKNAAITSTMILLIVAGASTFGSLVTLLQITQKFTEWAVSSSVSGWGIIVLIMIIAIILGMFMDGIALTMIVVPIVFATVLAMGFDPIWFGVLFTLNMEIGLISPPVGMTLYTVKGVSDVDFSTIVKGSLPFLLVLLFCLVVIGLFEPISLWIPSMMK